MAKETDKQIIIDEHFFVPQGVIDVRHASEEEGSTFYSSPDDVAAPDVYIPDATSEEVPVLMPPTSFSVYEQRVRIASDGRAVVDVVLDFPDMYGAKSIDVRVTKA